MAYIIVDRTVELYTSCYSVTLHLCMHTQSFHDCWLKFMSCFIVPSCERNSATLEVVNAQRRNTWSCERSTAQLLKLWTLNGATLEVVNAQRRNTARCMARCPNITSLSIYVCVSVLCVCVCVYVYVWMNVYMYVHMYIHISFTLGNVCVCSIHPETWY